MDLLSAVFVVSMLSSYLKERANTLKSKQINKINTLIERLQNQKDIELRRLNSEFQSIGLNFNKIMSDYQNTVRGSTADKIRQSKEHNYIKDINANLKKQKDVEDVYQDTSSKATKVIRDLEERNPYEYLKNEGSTKIDRVAGAIGNLVSKD